MAKWQNGKLKKWQIDKMCKLTKWHIDNGKFMK